jgi:hypothetical protein
MIGRAGSQKNRGPTRGKPRAGTSVSVEDAAPNGAKPAGYRVAGPKASG